MSTGKASMSGALSALLIAAALGACDDVRFRENPVQIDSFLQTPAPMVDILWVVDNSGTMVEEQAELGDKFDQFMELLVDSGTDYHIGIVSTDTEDVSHSGRLQGSPLVITRETADPRAAFAANVQLPQTVSRTERGLEAVRLALGDELLAGHNAGFMRPEAALFVIVVSDEDDQSRGPWQYYVRWLEHLKGAGNENLVSLSAIVGDLPGGCGGTSEAGERYARVQEGTGGMFHSICEADYGPVVEELGIVAAGLVRKFGLSEIPQPQTLQVLKYEAGDVACQAHGDCPEGQICAAGHRCALELDPQLWTYLEDENAIFFHGQYLPPAGCSIEVAYYRLRG